MPVPELWKFPPVPLTGEWHSTRRIERLRRDPPDDYDSTGRRRHVGVLYESPDDPDHGFDALFDARPVVLPARRQPPTRP
jgi:hypothetical protein